jgi:non-ribosomal peptide synthetase component E (peptide arylation enzyme)
MHGWSKQHTVGLPNSKALRKAFAATLRLCVPPSLPLGGMAKWRQRLNCLKRKPRLLFGRARFDLFRQKVLCRASLASQCSNHAKLLQI